MNKKLKWSSTTAGRMTIVYVITAFVVVSVVAAIAMFSDHTVFQIIMTLVGLAVFACISLIFGKYITNQIDKVAARLEDISAGDVHTFTEKIEEKNEFDCLYNTLGETVLNLHNVITEINNGLDKLAAGDLSYELPDSWCGDFGLISRKYHDITASLRTTFRNINNASSQVSTGSQQVADGAQTLSQGATEQAASIEQLTVQIESISSKVDNTASAAGKAMQIVNNTGDKIRECGSEMERMLSAMDDINHSSSEISKIIKVIDDIAFQTNILALNAAVEAARAGSAGKGFAVVADEVRNLAAKSAEAANQTTSLIENSIENVKRGADIAHQTAGTLNEIVENAALISKEVTKISDDSGMEASEIRKISNGVEQIAAVVQSNTATAEESAATSEQLSGQSGVLRSLLSHFKIDGEDTDSESAPISYEAPEYDHYEPVSSSEPENNFSDTFDDMVSAGSGSGGFEEPAPIDNDDVFVPVDFSGEGDDIPVTPAKKKPAQIILDDDDDFENVSSKY